MGITIEFELGVSYRVTLLDESVKTFRIIGGPNLTTYVQDENGKEVSAPLNEVFTIFRKIERLDD